MDYMKLLMDMTKQDYAAAADLYDMPYEQCSTEKIMLSMRDGIRLKTTIYKPADQDGKAIEKPFPVILERGCYPHNAQLSQIHGEQLARFGYVFVSQFCRGTGGSEGEWVPNIHERPDGLDTVRWLADQPWVDVIGFWGSSYLALTGWAIADEVPDKVRGMCLTHYGTDRFTSAYEKGMFRQDVLTAWAKGNAGIDVKADLETSYRYRPQIDVDENLWGIHLDWYRDWISHSKETDPYWQQGFWQQLKNIPSKVTVPIYMRSGWFDHHHGSSMKTWNNLPEETRGHCWLDIGGWNHGFQPCMADTKKDHLDNSEVKAILQWFDLVLKQKIKPQQRIRTYVAAADRWLNLPDWPLRQIIKSRFALEINQQNGVAGTLETRPPKQDKKITYVYDPENPVRTIGAESLLASWNKAGSQQQPEPGYREDVLSFISGPLEAPLLICGRPKVRLSVSSDAEDTAFTARIMEIRNNGKAYNIRSSITRMNAGQDPYIPGDIRAVEIDFWSVVYECQAGSRIRIDISSSDFPQYHIHTNKSGPWALQSDAKEAVQTIYSGPTHTTTLELPLLPAAMAADMVE